MIRVVVLDRDPLGRTGVRETLGQDKQVCTVGEGAPRAVAALTSGTHPDIVVTRHAQAEEAVTVLRALQRVPTRPAALVVLDHLSDNGIRQLLRHDVAGIFHASHVVLHLPWAIRALADGRAAFDPGILKGIIDVYLHAHPRSDDQWDARARLQHLSHREREVLDLLGGGLSNPAIAQCLNLSLYTVKDHIRAILAKLGTDNRVKAARIAWEASFSQIPRPGGRSQRRPRSDAATGETPDISTNRGELHHRAS